MSSQTASGKAFEYAIIQQLQSQLSAFGSSVIQLENEPLATARAYFEKSTKQQNCIRGAAAGIKHLIELEPYLQAPGEIKLKIQTASTGIQGDPRDVIISQDELDWELGISCKNNHSDLKHSRLSPKIDFGKQWVGTSVSEEYWNKVIPIFQEVSNLKQNGFKMWKEWCESKGEGHDYINQIFVIPTLKAFENELKELCIDPLIPTKLVQYIVGVKDFYQIINNSNQKCSKIVAFNLYGSLSNSTPGKRGRSKIPVTRTPTALISTIPKNTTLEVFFDQGWNLKFRLHTASSKIENSFKFAVGLCSIPASAYVHSQFW